MTDEELTIAYNEMKMRHYHEDRKQRYFGYKQEVARLQEAGPVTIEGKVLFFAHESEVNSREYWVREVDDLITKYPMSAILKVTVEVVGFDEKGWGY